jgi:hypothetical protein
MAWEWVAPTATAFSGTVGIYFTHRTGVKQQKAQLDLLREQIGAERLREIVKLKRDTYTRCISRFSEAHLYISFTIMEPQTLPDKNQRGPKSENLEGSETQTMRERLGLTDDSISLPDLRALVAELQLTAPRAVVDQARICVDTIISIGVNLKESMIADATTQINELIRRMAVDLDSESDT